MSKEIETATSNLPARRMILTVSGGRMLPEIGSKVYDRTLKQHAEVTEEGQRLFIEHHNALLRGCFERALHLSEMREQHLYSRAGFGSFEEYIEECWANDFGLRNAQRYALIGDKIRLMLTAAQESGQDVDALREELAPLKMTRWLDLIKIGDEDLKKLGAGEEFEDTRTGQKYSLRELKKIVGGDEVEKLKATTKKVRDLEEDLKTANAELDEYKRVHSGETTVAQEMALRVEKLTSELERLKGQRERGEELQKQLTRVREGLEYALNTIRNYAPHKPEDWENPDWVEVMIELQSLAAKYYMELQHWMEVYAASRKEFEG